MKGPCTFTTLRGRPRSGSVREILTVWPRRATFGRLHGMTHGTKRKAKAGMAIQSTELQTSKRPRRNPPVMEAAKIFKRCFEIAGVVLTPEIERDVERACELLYDSAVSTSRQHPSGYRPQIRREP